MRTAIWALAVVVLLPACKCNPTVTGVTASLKVAPVSVDFGPVKVGAKATQVITLESLSKTQVNVSGATIEGAGEFTVGMVPPTVDALMKNTFELTFSPTAVARFEGTLVVSSNDPDRPTIRVPLTGDGAQPKISVTPDCAAARQCVGSVTVTPPAIDFGAEPFVRLLPIDASRLPSVNIVNEGDVALVLQQVSIQGADAAAFTFTGNAMVPQGGAPLDPQQGVNLAIRFKPTSEGQTDYVATMVVLSDDPANPSVSVSLKGKLRPNQAPVVCANVIRVEPELDAPRDYSTKADWDAVQPPPAGGYDFSSSRDIDPRANVLLSALSDAADQTKCTSDPEDGRAGLTYLWTLVSTPPGVGSLMLSGASTPTPSFRPVVTGEYGLELSVKDTQGHETKVPLKLAVAVKNDLVAQLQWPGFSDVDLDVHLVRPSAATSADAFSGAFDEFRHGTALKTSGDINGYARSIQLKFPGGGYDFDWGLPGTSDDPRLNIDDEGNKGQIENVSLNKPENDPLCGGDAGCTYRVMVHYFKDTRLPMTPPACVVDGGAACVDGAQCDCAQAGARCVTDSAPAGDAGVGAGKCYAAPKPVVRIFLKGSAIPAKVIPLDTLSPADDLALGAPCQMLHVADVVWPPKKDIGSLPDGGTPLAKVTAVGADGTGRITAPSLTRFGVRQAGGSLQCAPDVSVGSFGWYTRQP
ncbi:MAG: choice-of-anchor D domain-containing protein [Myxococcaceae bacterium]|nr:choice-of-anchor D domain-containing protein [Myxococcaceae bacterium]